jgi:hypothetical protein
MMIRRIPPRLLLAALSLGAVAQRAAATGVPVSGFSPLVGISLTDEYEADNDPTFTFFQADLEPTLVGSQFPLGGSPYYDMALLDTGAAASLITSAADAAFDIEGAGYRGSLTLTIGGATGFLEANINNAMSLFATGLANRTGSGGATLGLTPATLLGQSSISLLTMPPESDLPNVLGIPFSSQYATYIRNDQPQVFQVGGKTVRTPQLQFLPLGSGGQGITRRVPITLDAPGGFSLPPAYVINFDNLINGDPLTEDPQAPTVMQEAGAYFLPVSVNNEGQSLTNSSFFFDTGADVTVVSQLNAVRLGFDPVLDTPDFTISVTGSGGATSDVPGFFVDQFTIQAVGGSITLNHVPVVALDVVNPAHPGNIVDGIVGMNLLAGRNVVIDPKPALGGGGVGPSLYISDQVTTTANWISPVPLSWDQGGAWSTGSQPGALTVANVRRMAGGSAQASVGSNASAWEVNVSGLSADETMTLVVDNNATLTTFAGLNIEQFGQVNLVSGNLDVQYVDIRAGGRLSGNGAIATGSGPIPGQVENVSGVVAPSTTLSATGIGAINIAGRYSNGDLGVLEMEIAGADVDQYDRIIVDGPATLAGTLRVLLPGANPHVPGLTQVYTLLTATEGIGGKFDVLDLPALSPNLMWYVGYGETSMFLKVTLLGDFNGDSDVNAADLAVWKGGYGTTYNGADFLAWQQHLGMHAAVSAGVPEPGSAVLLAMAAAGAAGARRKRRVNRWRARS